MDSRQLRQLFVSANAFKEGDLLVGGTRDELVRRDARETLKATTLGAIDAVRIVDDGVSETITQSIDRSTQRQLASLTIAQLAARLLARDGPEWIRRHRAGLTSEAIAAVTRVMTNDELSSVARRVFNPMSGDGITIGASQHFGSRIQPNSPGDSDEEILFAILEGLSYGCGDVIIGLNPASDELDTIVRLEQLLADVVKRLALPTRYCVLSDLPKQHAARARGAVDVGFQSLAGTSKALSGMVGLDVEGILDLARDFDGLYFETGQGSAVTNGTAEDVDMVTLESRTYGVARYLAQQTGKWMIVNDVAGFIGPEVFRTTEQLERACLEDIVMGKLHGLTMGLDVCATFHMGIAPPALRQLTAHIVQHAAPAYLMAVAGNADPMLGYLTTSFREHPLLRQRVRREQTTAMRSYLAGKSDHSAPALYARYAGASIDEGRAKLARLREAGFDLGYGNDETAAADARVNAIYEHARTALHAALDSNVIAGVAPASVLVQTEAKDREDYLNHPQSGERLTKESATAILAAFTSRRSPQVQMVVSDGLNANAINEQLRGLFPPLVRALLDAQIHVDDLVTIVTNGRVRAGYHIGQIVNPEIIVHIIGERPGTGLNTASAYLTYGRHRSGQSRWSPALDHSCTTAVCGIHAKGKPAAVAAKEIARTIVRMIETRSSGVALVRALSESASR